MSVSAIMPEPRIELMPRAWAKAPLTRSSGVSSPARRLLTVLTAAMMISGAAEPRARKDAPATSSGRLSLWHRVSRDGARCSSATTAMPTKE